MLYFAISVLCCIKGLSLTQSFFVGLVVFVVLGIPYFNKLKEKTSKKFLDLEMVN